MIKSNDHLQGKLVTLQPLREQFFEEYHRMFSPTVRHWLGLPSTADMQVTVDFLSAALVDEQYYLFYGIFDNQTNKLIGSIVVRSPEYPKGQLGSWLNEHYWGGGRYQEALYLALKKYFELTGSDSIFAYVEEGNVRSLRAHQKGGFVIVDEAEQERKYLCPGIRAHKLLLTCAAFDAVRKRFEGDCDVSDCKETL